MTSEIVSAFTAGVDSVSTSIFELIGIALPIGLTLAGAYIAIRKGWAFVKSIVGGR